MKKALKRVEEQSELVRELLFNGSTINQISERIGVSKNYISEYCRSVGWHYPLERFTNEEIEIIKNNTNITDEEISDRYMPYRSAGAIKGIREKLKISKEFGKIWSDNNLRFLINNFSNKSMEYLLDNLIGFSKNEIVYMSRKLKLKKSENRIRERYFENTRVSPSGISRRKIQGRILELISYFNGDVHVAVKYFQENENETSYPKKSNIDFLFSQGFITKETHHLYYDIYCPIGTKLNEKESFELYLENFDNRGMCFGKESTKNLFIYWSNSHGFDLSRENLLSIKEFKSIFKESKLETSIRKNYEYTYEFIADLLNDPDLKPYDIRIQVPDKYWDKKENVFCLIDRMIGFMLNENIILCPEDIYYLSRNEIYQIFPSKPFHSGRKKIILEYFLSRGIRFDASNLIKFDDFVFDSKEELYVYKKIKNLGFYIQKIKRSEKYNNESCGERYIPDFRVMCDDGEYIVEYFGLYNFRKESSYGDNYNQKTRRKIEYFSNNFNFISIFPEDLKNKGNGIIKKMEERRKNIGY